MTKAVPVAPALRTAQPGEAAAISELALRSKAHWGYPAEFIEACREELFCTEQDLRSTTMRVVVCEAAGRLVGYYMIEKLANGNVELDALFVEPEFIGHGFGRRLVEAAKAEARNWGAAEMIVQDDPNADRFYRAAGGVPIGQRASGSIPNRFLPLYRIPLQQETEAQP